MAVSPPARTFRPSVTDTEWSSLRSVTSDPVVWIETTEWTGTMEESGFAGRNRPAAERG